MTIRHVLFPYDCSPRGRDIVPYVREIAQRFSARVTILGVVPPTFAPISAEDRSRLHAGADTTEWKQSLQNEINGAFVDELSKVTTDRVADVGDPAIRIVEFAHHHEVDLIAMPTHGAGRFRSLLIGSVTAKVLHDARCPIWTATHAETQTAAVRPKKILCAIDGSATSSSLLRWSSTFARCVGANVEVLHVVGPVTDWPELESERRLQDGVRETARTRLESVLKSAGIETPFRVAVGDIVQSTTEHARREGMDLVVIGRGTISEPFGRLRTHAFGIIQQSPCPVISV